MTGATLVKSMNKFKIVDKPMEASVGKSRCWGEIAVAIANLDGSKSIFLTKSDLVEMGTRVKDVQQIRGCVNQQAKKLKIKVGVCEKPEGFYFYKKGA